MTQPLRFRAAAALPGHVALSVQEVEVLPPGSGEVLVEVLASGICASDRHVMAAGMNFGRGERTFVSSVYGSGDVRRDIPRLVALAEAQRFDLASLVSSTIPLLPGPVSAAVTTPDPDAVRTVIVPKSG
jgi:Zn-dependent alcohol dehydrogenase